MTIAVDVESEQTPEFFDHRHRTMTEYKAIQALSNVNHQVRNEFGTALWSNIDISVEVIRTTS
jgi:hypothetical protein